MSQLPNPTAIDIDDPHIAADGRFVAVIWLDDRGSGAVTGNETFVRVSRDAGANFDAEVDVSQPTTIPVASGADEAWVAISAEGQGSIYCTYQDSRHNNGGDSLFLMYSKDGGVTWVYTDRGGARIMLNTNTADDVDDVHLAADGQAVAIAWMEEIPGGGNATNQLRVIVDPLGGLGWQVGTIPAPIDLSSGAGIVDVQRVEEVSMKGRFIAIAQETNPGETATLSWSCDQGLTWETRNVSDGTVDVDDPDCAVTLNGDINMIYLEDRAGGQSNTTVVSGIKVPTLVNDATASQGIKVSCAMGSVGNLAMVFFSGTLADMQNNAPVSFNNTGFSINLTNDPVYNIGISVAFSQPTVYFGTVDAQGKVAFPGIANFSSVIGVPIYCAVATAQANLTLGEFTDPVKLR